VSILLILGYQDWLCITAAVIVAIFVTTAVVYRIYSDKHEAKQNLPDISDIPFVGREKEVNDLFQYLDHGAPERIINIHGSPGFGKSHLAKYVGWRVFEKGVDVCYMDLTDIPEVGLRDYLVEKMYDETVSFDKFLRMIRKKYFDHLIIFDNSDDVIHNRRKELKTVVQEVIKNSQHFKFIITSREKISFLDQFEAYKVHELSKEAACDLLEHKIPNPMMTSLSEREELAELTGSIPLALKIIGSLLRLGIPGLASPSAVIAELKIEPVSTLSHEQLHDDSISASFYLSYRFLEKDQRIIGQLLSNFPGSFTLEACMNVLKRVVDMHRLLVSLVARSLLEYANDRYHFHSLIRDYFFKMQEESAAMEQFALGFQNFYFSLLKNATDMYNSKLFNNALAIVNEEKHNFLHLLKDLELGGIKCDLKFAITTIVNTIEAKLLENKFSYKVLLSVLQAYLTQRYDKYVIERSVLDEYTGIIMFPLFMIDKIDLKVLYHIIDIHYKTDSPEAAKKVFDKYSNKFYYDNEASLILSLVSRICSELGQHEESIRLFSYVRYRFPMCDGGECSYKSYGYYYKVMGDFKLATHYLNLSLTTERHTAVERLLITVQLHKMYLNLAQKSNLLDQIELADIIIMPPYELFQNMKDLNTIIEHLRNHNKAETAEILQECIVNTTFTMDAEVNVAGVVFLLQARYSKGQYQYVVELGQRTIERSVKQSVINLLVLVGKAKIWYGNISEGLSDMETALNLTLVGNDTFYEYWTCCFYLIPRLKYIKICFLDHLLKWVVHATFVLPLQPLQPIAKPVMEDPMSSSKDIVTLNTEYHLMQVLSKPFCTLTALDHEATMNSLLSLLENQFVRFIINVASVFLRLNIVTQSMSTLSLMLTHIILGFFVSISQYYKKTALSGFCCNFIFNHKHILQIFITSFGALSTIFEYYYSAVLFLPDLFLFLCKISLIISIVLQIEMIFILTVYFLGYMQSETLLIISVMHLLWFFSISYGLVLRPRLIIFGH
jgi:tetratricopeptide (TPR) repeat protein